MFIAFRQYDKSNISLEIAATIVFIIKGKASLVPCFRNSY